jgi:isocitrate/isopropylmalate dehydrogenase
VKGDNYAVFEPTHGSAPKYAGQYKVNPIAMLLTTKLMFDWLKENEMATRLESAIARVIAEDKVRTYDMAAKIPRSTWLRPLLIARPHNGGLSAPFVGFKKKH